MRWLCYAKFLPNNTKPPSEFFGHLGAIWSSIEDTPKTTIKTSNVSLTHNYLSPMTFVFITECQSLSQLTSYLATMPGAGISNVEIFPVSESTEFSHNT